MKPRPGQGQRSNSEGTQGGEVGSSGALRPRKVDPTWTKEQFACALEFWAPQYMDNEEAVDHSVDNLRYLGRYDTFLEAFRSMLLDPSHTLSEKANYYFEDFDKDAPLSPWGYFKFLWERLFPHEPFPIAVDPDPPREF